MTPAAYRKIRRSVEREGYGHEIDWAQGLKPPATADIFAGEFVWVVLNSGMKNQVAQAIANRLYPIIEAGESASNVFGHKAKCAAIDTFWRKRTRLFKEFSALVDDDQRFNFTDPKMLRIRLDGVAPCIGSITRWHLAKNLGCDVAKPDRHLERIARHYGFDDCHQLCRRLADKTGDRVATVDLVLWRASNLGIIDTRKL